MYRGVPISGPLMITDSGDTLWLGMFSEDPDADTSFRGDKGEHRKGARLPASERDRAGHFDLYPAPRRQPGAELPRAHRLERSRSIFGGI